MTKTYFNDPNSEIYSGFYQGNIHTDGKRRALYGTFLENLPLYEEKNKANHLHELPIFWTGNM